ncbi:MAG: cysteine--tRNA ligase [Deltaproteobacteria bacterium]|uniref:Cysteine--tRNA ligase n=1 Tax=Candidatus Zymogenus saltonus TaxID=2844893 RepID=A0A9D8PNI7_9DELT|nr:cysteine--tRNA ligase [Candidatus Zymogenus saltonus]
MTIRVHNTLSGKKEEFTPLEGKKVRMYVCGITAYDLSHLGHARAAVVFDVIYRYFKTRGYEVTYVRNFTDIDDKIIKRANELGISTAELSEKYIDEYHDDMDALGLLRPDFEPKATENIDNMISMIEKLFENGYAYKAGDDVLYSVKKFNGYGKLSGKNIDDLRSGARVCVDEKKEDPLDFVLWKGKKPGEPFWRSPWGDGRPGWHIECSAMSGAILGETIDIHGGGRDLVFPHHENEIAQSEAANKKPFVNYWIHNGFVNIDQEKMSKSLGNFFTIRDIREKYHPEVVRLFLLTNHYRSPIDFTEKNLRDAEEAVRRLYDTLGRLIESAKGDGKADSDDGNRKELLNAAADFTAGFTEAMDDDFNTAMALGKLFDFVHAVNRFLDRPGDLSAEDIEALKEAQRRIEEATSVFGILQKDPNVYFEEIKSLKLSETEIDPLEIERLIAERTEARANKDFAAADRIRDDLAEMGVILEDSPSGTMWKLK